MFPFLKKYIYRITTANIQIILLEKIRNESIRGGRENDDDDDDDTMLPFPEMWQSIHTDVDGLDSATHIILQQLICQSH